MKLILFKHGGLGPCSEIWTHQARTHAGGIGLCELPQRVSWSCIAHLSALNLVINGWQIFLGLLMLFVDFAAANPWLLMLLLTVRNDLLGGL